MFLLEQSIVGDFIVSQPSPASSWPEIHTQAGKYLCVPTIDVGVSRGSFGG